MQIVQEQPADRISPAKFAWQNPHHGEKCNVFFNNVELFHSIRQFMVCRTYIKDNNCRINATIRKLNAITYGNLMLNGAVNFPEKIRKGWIPPKALSKWQLTVLENFRAYITGSSWNAANSFCFANPIQNSSSSIFLQGRTFAPMYVRKCSSHPASTAKLYSLSTDTSLWESSISSNRTSSTSNETDGHDNCLGLSLSTAVQQLIATMILATPLNKKFFRTTRCRTLIVRPYDKKQFLA